MLLLVTRHRYVGQTADSLAEIFSLERFDHSTYINNNSCTWVFCYIIMLSPIETAPSFE